MDDANDKEPGRTLRALAALLAEPGAKIDGWPVSDGGYAAVFMRSAVSHCTTYAGTAVQAYEGLLRRMTE